MPDEHSTATSTSTTRTGPRTHALSRTTASSRQTSDMRGAARTSRREMRTGRAASSTSCPARASAYARLPFTLIADTVVGTCMMSPHRGASAASRSDSLREVHPTADVGNPSASSVLVAMPKRIVARYSFECPLTHVRSFVALPTPMTRTPVAMGSSVPPWPTLRVWPRRRTRATTSWLVMPAGLSMTSRPGHGLSGRRAMSD